MGSKQRIINTILLLLTSLFTAAILGISIAILVNVLNQSPQPQPNNDTNNTLNIPTPTPIQPSDKRYAKYKSVSDMFKSSINKSVNPCDDFYQYTCGAFNQSMSFDISDDSNLKQMVDQLTNDQYIASAPKAVQRVRWYFDKCVEARQNWDKIVDNGKHVTDGLQELEKTTGLSFPMLDGKPVNGLTFDQISQLLGILVDKGVPTLISPYVDTNWKDPTIGYAYFIDQPTTFKQNTYYRKTWESTRNELKKKITDTMNVLAKAQGKNLDAGDLAKNVDKILDFDYQLATTYSELDKTRRQYQRSYNPNTIVQLNDAYPSSIKWENFLKLSTGTSAENLKNVFNGTYNYFIVMEPKMLGDLLKNIKDNIGKQEFTNTLINYMFYRFVDSKSELLPWPKDKTNISPIVQISSSRRRSDTVRRVRKQAESKSEAQYDCAADTIDAMQYANARLFIDHVYPTEESVRAVREHVAKIASSIVIGFRSMIDQLDWMSPATKKGAYDKINRLAKNIAFPDWIRDNDQLNDYHSLLKFDEKTPYVDMMDECLEFNEAVEWLQLSDQSPADRSGFNGPPGITNAWYQPEFNSITFPAGILKQPFYDFDWPASINFGAMGVIAGHELTHGFDDEGVQWDSIGRLNGWMDAASNVSFTNMAKCVVDEYSTFCPLDKSKYGHAACVDGAQTQGENIADNGGIHAAFRAYKNYVNIYGNDGALPDDEMKHFTPDQLFFLSFARVWCQPTPQIDSMLRQLLVDVHSPSIYRVIGTIRNFPAFKNAFNCPNDAAYAPKDHCNVWVSDIDTSYGVPESKTETNIQPEEPITAKDLDKLSAYEMAVNYYKNSVNFSVDPCEDFFSYACGTFDTEVSFYTARQQNLYKISNQITSLDYQKTIKESEALTKLQKLYNTCVDELIDPEKDNKTLVSNNYVKRKVEELNGRLGAQFTLVYGGKVAKLPGAEELAKGLAYLSFELGIDTLVTPMVDTYWIDNTNGYQMFLDQNTNYLAKTYYQEDAWKNQKENFIKLVTDVVTRYAKLQNSQIQPNKEMIVKIADFEQMLATKYSTDDTERRQYKRSWNLKTRGELNQNYPFLNWDEYLNGVPQIAKDKIANGYKFVVMEPGQLDRISSSYNTSDAETLVNYLYVRLLLGTTQYLPQYSDAFVDTPEITPMLGLSRRKTIENIKLNSNNPIEVGASCASVGNNLMQFATGRVFIDYMYPDEEDITKIRNSTKAIIGNIITSFEGMISQLDWMSAEDKTTALNKTSNIVLNSAFPDWIKNKEKLDTYYNELNFTADNYYDLYDELIKFNILIAYRQLNKKETDRHDFLGQPATVNAWYQPELNSITIPAGILVPPYFHPNWPPSINYGAMGLVAGHELTHGFDDEGVQWNYNGSLAKWMTEKSTTKFKEMAQCVIDEYNQFCPLSSNNYQPNCVNGAQTQGENIADNGGIHAAYRAYRVHQSLDGPDARLPDRVYSQFTHDQLFFLGFAQVWCEKRRTDEKLYTQLMVDPHSPSMYRVQGTIQNFPAFQTAFNCRKGSKSAPEKHCHVWVPNNYE